jgi:hypothetical protein
VLLAEQEGSTMHITRLVAGALVVAAVITPALAMAQDARFDTVRKIDQGKAASSVDFAAARADAWAKANNRATLDNDVKNKLGQKQAATGIGIGGKSSAVVKNQNVLKNENVNVLKTGDITNYNANENKQIQTFGFPSVKSVR